MRARVGIAVITGLFALACTGETQVADTEPAPSDCNLANTDSLPGKSFVRQIKKDDGGYEEDKLARVTFVDEGGTIKAKYTVRSLHSVYTYSCKKDGDKKLNCVQDDPDLVEFCRALYANVGACTPETLNAVLGRPAEPIEDDVKQTVDRVEKEIKKLKPDELEKLKSGYNNPNVQLRGLLDVQVKNTGEECRLTVSDKYETFSQGKRREMENVVGSARFVETNKPYVFEHCVDDGTFVAFEDEKAFPKPYESVRESESGKALTFRYVGDVEQKPQSGCTYTMDTWYDYEPVATAIPVQTDDKGRLFWGFPKALGSGRGVAHVYRYKACGGEAPKLVDVHCQHVNVP